MKKILTLALVLCFSGVALSQNSPENQEYESLFSLKNTRGYIALNVGSMNLTDDNLSARTGGTAAVIFNHKLAIGVTGSGFVGYQNTNLSSETYSVVGGYGGLLIEPIIGSHKAVHLSFPVSFGAGQSQFFKDSLGYREWDNFYRDEFVQDFIYIEPGVNVEFNLAKFMRFGVGASYMLSDLVNTTLVSTNPMDGLGFSANLKFGWFK